MRCYMFDRLALHVPAPSPQAMESAQAFMARVAKMDVDVCPCCKVGRLRVTAVLLGIAPQGCGGKAAPPASQRMCSMPGG